MITSLETGSHAVVPGEVHFGIDLDGVALIAGDLPDSNDIEQLLPLCTGALITDRHVTSAAHCFDEDNDAEPDPLFTGLLSNFVRRSPGNLLA